MILVTGGAFQGKTSFIREHFLPDGERPEGFVRNGKEASFEELCTCGCVMNFELWIKRELEAIQRGEGAEGEADESRGKKAEGRLCGMALEEIQAALSARVREIIRRNPGLIIELQEMGCGVVPIEKKDRIYRECCGRIGCLIAENGSEVYRVICGLGQRLQ